MALEPKEKKSGCYLYYRDIADSNQLTGIDKKVLAQIKTFNESGLSCEYIYCKGPDSFVKKAKSCLPFFSDGIQWPDPKSMSKYSFLYMRRPTFASKEMLRFFQEAQQNNPQLKILYEVPTYPYDDELKAQFLYPILLKDRANRKQLNRYVDRIITLTDDSEIFNTKTIKITNGLDLPGISPKKPVQTLETINVIVVAQFAKWHGLDRLVAGLIKYYNNNPQREIVLHIVGDGEVLQSLRQTVDAASLNRCVIFHGYCNPKELDALYDNVSIAVESLGFHRIGLSVSSTLKSREYLAKGIPFVTANEIDVFVDDPVDFCLQVPRDDTPVSIQAIIDFHDRLYSVESQNSLINRIRAIADTRVSMEQSMKNVIDYIIHYTTNDGICK